MQFYLFILIFAPTLRTGRPWLIVAALVTTSWLWRYQVMQHSVITGSTGVFPRFWAMTQLPGLIDEFAAAVSAFLVALIEAVPYKTYSVLTDNSIQFTIPPRYVDGPTARYMTHMFDMRSRENGIEHRLTKVKHPWTNGQVERMNPTIKEATVKRYHYDRHDQFESHLFDFVNA